MTNHQKPRGLRGDDDSASLRPPSTARSWQSKRLLGKLERVPVSDSSQPEDHARSVDRKDWPRQIGYVLIGLAGCSAAAVAVSNAWMGPVKTDRNQVISSQIETVPSSQMVAPKLPFELFAEHDALTGKLLQSVQSRNETGQTIAVAISGPSTKNIKGNVTFLIDPSAYICPGVDNEILVEYVYVAGGMVSQPGGIRWSVSGSHKALILPKGYHSDVLYETGIHADEIRFRYTDGCGATNNFRFDTKGLEAGVRKLAAP